MAAMYDSFTDAVREAVRAEVQPLCELVAELVKQLAAPPDGGLEHIDAILGLPSKAAGRMYLSRHPHVKAIGVQVGRSLLFDRGQVIAMLKGRQQGGRRGALRAVAGGR